MNKSRVFSLTTDEIKFIQEALENKMPYTEICKTFGISNNTMSKWVKILKTKNFLDYTSHQKRNKDIVSLFKKGVYLGSIAEQYKLTKQSISSILHKNMSRNEYSIYKRIYENKFGLETDSQRRYKPNPNPPTETTHMLICNYYEDGLEKRLPEELIIDDISLELGRSKKYIGDVLANEKTLLKRLRKAR